MHNDIFSKIKELLTMRDVAEAYGLEVNRAGKALCPFHNDSDPSLHIYPGSRGWYCWACNAGGDVIDFAARLFGISPRQAAVRLDNDFRLGLSDQSPGRRTAGQWLHEQRRKRAEIAGYRAEYTAKTQEAYYLRTLPKPPPETPRDSPLWGQYAALLGRLDYLDSYYFESHKWR